MARDIEVGVRVEISFPWTETVYHYLFSDEQEQSYVHRALRAWYEKYAMEQFALAGLYAPMDVKLFENGRWMSGYNLCYCEGWYDVFMNHRVGDPWHGDFVDFIISLSQKRAREERKVSEELGDAA